MKQVTINLYTAEELKEKFPKAFEKALSNFQNPKDYFVPWVDETVDSFIQVFEKCYGIKLKDYNIGYPGTYVKFEFSYDEVGDFSGHRAIAWLENNLFGRLRIDWYKHNPKRKTTKYYGQWPDEIRECPLTGYCCDREFLLELQKSILNGENLRMAFSNLAHVCQDLVDQEYEYYYSEESFLDQMDANDVLFDEYGKVFDHK